MNIQCVTCNDTGERHYFDFNEPCGSCRIGWNKFLQGTNEKSAIEFKQRIEENNYKCIENAGTINES